MEYTHHAISRNRFIYLFIYLLLLLLCGYQSQIHLNLHNLTIWSLRWCSRIEGENAFQRTSFHAFDLKPSISMVGREGLEERLSKWIPLLNKPSSSSKVTCNLVHNVALVMSYLVLGISKNTCIGGCLERSALWDLRTLPENIGLDSS